jgi:hypothetical protein
MNGAVWDINTGAMLKLGEGNVITHAMLGFEKLTREKICGLYGDPPLFSAIKFQSTTRVVDKEKGAHWVMLGRDDYCLTVVILQVVHLMREKIVKEKTYSQLAFDLLELKS